MSLQKREFADANYI